MTISGQLRAIKRLLPQGMRDTIWKGISAAYGSLWRHASPDDLLDLFHLERLRRILILRNNYLGDMIVFLPTLSRLRDAFPSGEIVLLSSHVGMELIKDLNLADKFLLWDHDWVERRAGWREIWRLRVTLSALSCDLMISTTTTGYLTHLAASISGIPFRIGFNNTRWHFLNTISIPFDHEGMEATENLKILLALGIDGQRPPVNLTVSEDARRSVETFVNAGPKSSQAPVVGLHVGTKQEANRWVPERWAQLADRLTAEFDTQVVLTGDPKDRPYANRVVAAMETKPLDAVGSLSLQELIAIIDRCSAYISHDTGPMHIAVVRDVFTVGLFGKASPNRWGYPNREDFVAIHKPAPCRPCHKTECESRECMWAIEVDEVFDAVAPQFVKLI